MLQGPPFLSLASHTLGRLEWHRLRHVASVALRPAGDHPFPL